MLLFKLSVLSFQKPQDFLVTFNSTHQNLLGVSFLKISLSAYKVEGLDFIFFHYYLQQSIVQWWANGHLEFILWWECSSKHIISSGSEDIILNRGIICHHLNIYGKVLAIKVSFHYSCMPHFLSTYWEHKLLTCLWQTKEKSYTVLLAIAHDLSDS